MGGQVSVGAQSQTVDVQKEEAVVASFCTHYQHSHTNQRNTLPVLSLILIGKTLPCPWV